MGKEHTGRQAQAGRKTKTGHVCGKVKEPQKCRHEIYMAGQVA